MSELGRARLAGALAAAFDGDVAWRVNELLTSCRLDVVTHEELERLHDRMVVLGIEIEESYGSTSQD